MSKVRCLVGCGRRRSWWTGPLMAFHSPVPATGVHDRFLVVGVDESLAPPVRMLHRCFGPRVEGSRRAVWVCGSWGMKRFGTGPDEEVRPSDPRRVQAQGCESGEVTPDVVVFDNAVTRLADLRAGPLGRARPATDGTGRPSSEASRPDTRRRLQVWANPSPRLPERKRGRRPAPATSFRSERNVPGRLPR